MVAKKKHVAVTLADVARLAGVSLTTASRVINNTNYPVSETTRDAVLRAAEKLNYTPNALARSLTTSRSQTIGIIIGDITDPYFAEITAGVEERSRGANMLTMVCNGRRDISAERNYLRLLSRHRADGVILAGGISTDSPHYSSYQDEIAIAVRNGMRVVAVGPRGLPGVHSVIVDDTAMVTDVTRHVISLGHKNIVYVMGPRNYTTARLRFRGFDHAMSAAGLSPVAIIDGGFDFQAGQNAAKEILGLAQLPDAVIVDNDGAALGVIAAFNDASIRVPDDVSVTGVDDIRESAVVGLTTVAVPLRELGRQAAAFIIRESTDVGEKILPHELRIRRTTAPGRRRR